MTGFDIPPRLFANSQAYRACNPLLPTHRNTNHIAPLPDLLVVQAVDGLVFPHRADTLGGQRRGVGGVGLGVDVEQH